MLRCEGTNNKPSPLIAKAYRNDCFISTGPLLKDATTVAAAGVTVPALNERTGLVVQSVDGSPAGSSIKFGQPFALSTYDKSVRENKVGKIKIFLLKIFLFFFSFICIVMCVRMNEQREIHACK